MEGCMARLPRAVAGLLAGGRAQRLCDPAPALRLHASGNARKRAHLCMACVHASEPPAPMILLMGCARCERALGWGEGRRLQPDLSHTECACAYLVCACVRADIPVMCDSRSHTQC
jgi:hypothetical protein